MNLNLSDIAKFAFNPKVETYSEMQNSFFKDVYFSAEKCIEEIIKQNSKKNENGSEKKEVNGAEHSNIVAFTGGRGSGKTSAMLSVAELLKANKKLDGKSYEDVNAFIVLDMIEPSNISKDETVMDVVLSRLFTYFEEEYDKRVKKGEENDISQEHRRKVLKAFDEAYQAVRMTCLKRDQRYDLPSGVEGLSHIAAGNKLRKLMQKLIDSIFCALFRDNTKDKPFFVLCVDDVDMNISQGYEICEDLRKYFNITGVIVLFSLYTDQMNDVVKQRYIKDFKMLLDSSKGNTTSETIPFMAAKYMEKLIPYGRRCPLPDMRIINPKDIQIKPEEPEKLEKPKKPEKLDYSLVDEIFLRLFEKTGLILIKNEYSSHGFIPTSLRSAVHLLYMLEKMPSVKLFPDSKVVMKDEAGRVVKDGKGEDKTVYKLEYPDKQTRSYLDKNLDALLHFIHEYDLNEIENPDSIEILKQLSTWPLVTLNKHVCKMLYDAIVKLTKDMKEEEKPRLLLLLKELMDFQTSAKNITMGDLFCLAREYSEIEHNCDTNGHFFALFRLIYSIRMLKCYFTELDVKDTKTAKNKLYEFLGGLIHEPVYNKITSNDDLLLNLSLEKLNEHKNGTEYDDLIDAVLLRVTNMGTLVKNASIREWNIFRKYHVGAFYSDVSRESLIGMKGNTISAFTYNYLGFVLSLMRDSLEFKGARYKEWREKYISPLPIFSADFVDLFVSKLLEESQNSLKNVSAPHHQAIWDGSKKLMNEFRKFSNITNGTKEWFETGFDEFPYTSLDVVVEDLQDNGDMGKQNIKVDSSRYITSTRIPRSENERIYKRRLQTARNKYDGLQKKRDDKYLDDSQGVNLSKIEMNSKERAKGEIINAKIRMMKQDFLSVYDQPNSQYYDVVNQIIELIDEELRSIGS